MLTATDFVMVEGRLGAQFVGAGKVVSFPAAVGSVQNIELDRGQVEFWYRPNYDAGSDDDTGHALIVVGDVYDVPRLELQESDRLSLVLMEADWTDHTVSAGYHAPLWTAGQWVHIRATWDTALTTDALKLYVNDTRVDSGGAAGDWNLVETTIGNIFVGSADASGDFVADGIIDELVIRDEPQTPATPTPTGTPLTPTPTATGTPTLMPGCIDRTNPALVVTPAAQPLQPVGTPFTAPDFCTTLRRVSNTSDSGGFETQIYNQLQAFSSDNVYLLLDSSDGFVVRRVSDLSLVTGLDTSGWNDPRWHPVQPHVMIHFDGNDDTTLRVQYTNIDTLQTTTIFTFPAQYERIRVPQSSDEISEDGRWLAGMASRNDGVQVIFALDLQNLTLGAELPIPDLYAGPCEPDPVWGEVEPDWVGVSPLGNYLVVQWVRAGTTRCSGLETFDIQTGAFAGRVTDNPRHGDLGVDSDGVTEFFMTTELSSPADNNRPAIAMRVLPGTATVSPPTYLQVVDWSDEDHISCRGPNGVCLVSWGRLGETNDWPFEDELFLQYTDGSVLRLAHHRSSKCGYWVQPRASISRDGRYVVFASDWGEETGTDSCGDGNDMGRGDPYIIDLLTSSFVPSDFVYLPVILK
jgi:hypothetical protein